MKLEFSITLSIILLATVFGANAVAIQVRNSSDSTKIDSIFQTSSINGLPCPNYRYRCPNCPKDQECVYPNSGGCPDAGIPICRATQCHGLQCLVKTIPCPKECPFSCRYSGPACCPFLGNPVCEPVCESLVACKVTPCPKDCPDSCYFPNADFCCPKSGKPVCKKDAISALSETSPTVQPILPTSITYMSDARDKVAASGLISSAAIIDPFDSSSYSELSNHKKNHRHRYGSKGGTSPEVDENYPPQPVYQYNGHQGSHKERRNDKHKENLHRDHGIYYDEHPDQGHHCPDCTQTITDVVISLEFATSIRDEPDIISCPRYVIPCPIECPYSCIYPMDQPCPFSNHPWCPSVYDVANTLIKSESAIHESKGHPFPYFPANDPYRNSFTSLLNGASAVESTISTATPTTIPQKFCPLIVRMCPKECPNSCLRPDVPCPFAEEGYCPGNNPPSITTDAFDSLITSPTSSVSESHPVACPLYILACPVCPEEYSCTRATTGRCPNTNVPYCYSTATLSSSSYDTTEPTHTALLGHHPEQNYIFGNQHWGKKHNFKAMMKLSSLLSSEAAAAVVDAPNSASLAAIIPADRTKDDACVRSGLVKVSTKQTLMQLQEKDIHCEEACSRIEWDEQCDNLCIFRTEKSCCIETLCLPN